MQTDINLSTSKSCKPNNLAVIPNNLPNCAEKLYLFRILRKVSKGTEHTIKNTVEIPHYQVNFVQPRINYFHFWLITSSETRVPSMW